MGGGSEEKSEDWESSGVWTSSLMVSLARGEPRRLVSQYDLVFEASLCLLLLLICSAGVGIVIVKV